MGDNLANQQIVFIGAGSMAEAIIRGLVEQEKVKAGQIHAVNRSNQAQLDLLHSRYRIQASTMDNIASNAIRNANIIVFAMKPKDAAKAIAGLKNQLHDKQLLISVIAGLSIETIEKLLNQQIPLARTMPNTSSSIGLGSTGISFSAITSESQRKIAIEIFTSVGEVSIVDEARLDIVTGVSGCGPAYVYYLLEAMISGGIQGGLNEEMARQLAVQTVLGAASMVKITQEDPAVLRKKVTSPNGATQAALETMDRYLFTEGVEKAVLRAAERAQELGAMIAAEAIKQSNS
jgi:pyrroline-5-carboxylate reductase